MTEKIICNGVDVTDCDFIRKIKNDYGVYECFGRYKLGDGMDDFGIIGREPCKNYPNCKFKQLKRQLLDLIMDDADTKALVLGYEEKIDNLINELKNLKLGVIINNDNKKQGLRTVNNEY